MLVTGATILLSLSGAVTRGDHPVSRTALTRLPASEHRMAGRVKCAGDAGRGLREATGRGMKELLRTNDVVRLSWAQARLKEAGIDSLVLDHHTSLVEGSIGAIPRRLMVARQDHRRARALIEAAEEELR
ncbi:MAG TPA: DUF2007 domain-containing protein [Stellaceae bacterium]|nr:DUF2007 domain-containing protein [Stellaceae bacterium]